MSDQSAQNLEERIQSLLSSLDVEGLRSFIGAKAGQLDATLADHKAQTASTLDEAMLGIEDRLQRRVDELGRDVAAIKAEVADTKVAVAAHGEKIDTLMVEWSRFKRAMESRSVQGTN